MKRFEDKVLDQFQIASLLVKEVTEELSEAEAQELDAWKMDNANRILYQQLFEETDVKERQAALSQLELDREWYRFVFAMEAHKAPLAKKRNNRGLRLLTTFAAAAAIVLFVALFFQKNKNPKASNDVLAELEHIEPGKPAAELILSGGEVVPIDAIAQSNIKDQEVAINNKNGELVYDQLNATAVATVQMNTLRVPRGGEYKLTLSDGTKVWLNAETELTYPVAFAGDHRTVKLQGEAYFDVTHNPEKPFIVESGNQCIEVLGTSFNVSAYQTDEQIVTTLVEGKVNVSVEQNHQMKSVVLRPEEQLVNELESNELKVYEVDTYTYTSWKDGRFVFRNETLEHMMTQLARWYQVDVIFKSEESKQLRFSGDFERYSELNDFLKLMAAETSVTVDLNEEDQLLIGN